MSNLKDTWWVQITYPEQRMLDDILRKQVESINSEDVEEYDATTIARYARLVEKIGFEPKPELEFLEKTTKRYFLSFDERQQLSALLSIESNRLFEVAHENMGDDSSDKSRGDDFEIVRQSFEGIGQLRALKDRLGGGISLYFYPQESEDDETARLKYD